ncbi:MAG: hypothetical protein ACERKZ_18535 [Lachnotalea sp.]
MRFLAILDFICYQVIVTVAPLPFHSFQSSTLKSHKYNHIPLERLYLVLGQKFNRKLTTVRMGFDIFFLFSTIMVTLITKQPFYIREAVLNTRFSEFFKLYDVTVDGREIEKIYKSYLDSSSALIPNAEITLTKLRKMDKRMICCL